MDNYIFLIALGLVFCSLAIVALVFLHCRKIVEKCNYYIAKGIREQDCLAKQLERTRIDGKSTQSSPLNSEQFDPC